jgi:hypothetical protein
MGTSIKQCSCIFSTTFTFQVFIVCMLLQGKDRISNMVIDKIGYVGNTLMIIVRKVRLLKEQDSIVY